MVTVSVPGKIHLMGEHAVVYGRPAILTAINRRMRVSVEKAGQDEVVSTEQTEYAKFALGFVRRKLAVHHVGPVKITIDSEILAGFHLGSSAAVAVGITGAVLYYYKKIWNPVKINELAYEIEKNQHGNPSGGDNTAVTSGGFIWYRKELEFLKSMWQLPFKPHASLNHFFLINTGKPAETTGEMVALVKEHMQKEPDRMRAVFDRNEQQVKRVTVALKEGNESELIDAMIAGEKTLEEMGVVSKTVHPLMRSIESAGGAVKILGGGGKTNGVGFLLCYHRDMKTIQSLCQSYRFETQTILLGEEGIRLERKE